MHLYKDNFFQLREGTREAASEIKLSGWQRLKQLYPTVDMVNKKLSEAKEKGYSKEYIRVLENLKRYWTKRGK